MQEKTNPLEVRVTLTVTEGEDQGASLRLTAPRTVLGRKNPDLPLSDKKISQEHAAVEISGADVSVVDLESRNGILVNNKKVFRKTLADGDVIQLGLTKLKVAIDETSALRQIPPKPAGSQETVVNRDIASLIDEELRKRSKWDLSSPDEIVSSPEEAPQACGLEVIRGADAGRKIKIERRETVLGRTQGDILFPDGDVSRTHCRIEIVGKGHVVIRDLESTNGTHVNGAKVAETRLSHGDHIQIGTTLCRFTLED